MIATEVKLKSPCFDSQTTHKKESLEKVQRTQTLNMQIVSAVVYPPTSRCPPKTPVPISQKETSKLVLELSKETK
jgi:hypothetical protein